MNPVDFVLVVIIAVVFALALKKTIQNRKNGKCPGCGGSCGGCIEECKGSKK